jgi:hypothetical protein
LYRHVRGRASFGCAVTISSRGVYFCLAFPHGWTLAPGLDLTARLSKALAPIIAELLPKDRVSG